jgi:hypothetical protein
MSTFQNTSLWMTLLHLMAAAREICSSLLLQQLLYYNIYFSIAWVLTVGVRVHVKVRTWLLLCVCGT